LSADTATAYITDGGRRGSLTGQFAFGDKPLLKYLYDEGYENLVVTCSHPHADHAGGLLELAKHKGGSPSDPDLRNFANVVFIDSGYPANETLLAAFEDVHGTDHPHVARVTAENQNAFASSAVRSLTSPDASVQVSNFVYKPDEAVGIHGHSVITHYVLASPDGESRTLVTDFDDADNRLIQSWAAWAEGNLPQTTHRVYVAPHHNSDLSNIGPLLSERIRPDSVVITANAGNRFRHPGPANWLKWVTTLGSLANVHVTGAGHHVKITSAGLPPQTRDELDELHDRIVAPMIRDIDRDLRQLEESPESGSVKPATLKRIQGRAVALRSLQEKFRDGSPPDFERPLAKLPHGDPLARGRGGDPFDPNYRPRPDPDSPEPSGGGGGPGSGPPKTPKEPSGGVGDYRKLKESFNSDFTDDGGGAGGGSHAERRSARFRFARRGYPIFGGVVIGNRVESSAGDLLKARISVRKEVRYDEEVTIPEIQLLLDGQRGQEWFVYDNMTMTELWAAYHFVQPLEDWRAEYQVADQECNLVGIAGHLSDESNPGWKFGVHPATANTIVALDAMRLDMLVSLLQQEETETLSDRLDDEFEPLEGKWQTYQWYDAEAILQFEDGQIAVVANTDPKHILLRLRLWSRFPQNTSERIRGRFDEIAELGEKYEEEEYQAKLEEYMARDEETRQDVKTLFELLASNSDGVELKFADKAVVEELYSEVRAVRRIDHFARIVALLNYIKDQEDVEIPILPGTITPIRVSVPPELQYSALAQYLGVEMRRSALPSWWLWVGCVIVLTLIAWVLRRLSKRKPARA
jgi:hypothetical protein